MIKPITKADALAAYGDDTQALADALGITRSAIYQWKDGPIPSEQALRLTFVLKPDVFADRAA